MANQKINDVDTITTFSGTDRLLVNTDVVNNVLKQIEKDDFIADIISTDSGNFIDIGTDNKLVLTSTNSANELVKLNSSGQYPALDGSLITGITTAPEIPQTTCATAAATATKTATLTGVTIADDVHFYVNFTNANTSSTITLNVNSEGDWDIYDLKGNQITGDYFSNADDETVLLKADKTNTRFILITAPFWESRMSLPSNIYIDLTLPPAYSTYSVVSDGYLLFAKHANGANQMVFLGVLGLGGVRTFAPSGYEAVAYFPVSKGETVLIDYTAGGTTNAFRFIYAEGSKP